MQELMREVKDFILFLGQRPCLPIDKTLRLLVGLEGAVLLTDLIETYICLKRGGLLKNKEEWFYKTLEDREICTGITFHRQNQIIRDLKKRNFIETKKYGNHARIYFKINFCEIKNTIVNSESSLFKNLKSKHQSSILLYILNNNILHILSSNILNNKIENGVKHKNYFFINKESNKSVSRKLISQTSFSTSKKNKFVEHWNSINHVKGKHKNPDTKSYQETAKKFMRLKNGTFLKYYPIKFEYNNQQKTVTTELSQKWSDKKILATLDELSKMFLPEYWPIDKSKLARPLNTFLYNSMTRKSYFLTAALKGINKISTSTEMQESDYRKYLDSAIVDICNTRKLKATTEQRKELADLYAGKLPYFAEQFEKIIKYDLDKYSKIKLMYGIIDIIVFFELMDRSQSNSYGHYFGTLCSVYRDQEVYVGEPSQFIKYYINWLEEIYLSRDYALKPGAIGPKSSNWPDFCICMQDVYGFPVKQSMTISRRAPRPASKK